MPSVIWKGSISFGLVHIPVNLYSGQASNKLDFSWLDRRDMAPVGYKRYNKHTGKEVPSDEIVKGYEYEDDHYVVLTNEDFQRANVKATKTVDILAFIDLAEIHPIFFSTPYFLEPTAAGRKGYALLRETLAKTHRTGLARVVIHGREHIAAVIPYRMALVLNLLRYTDEIRDPDKLELPQQPVADELRITNKELDIAQQLVTGMSESWQPEQYHDEYRNDLLALIKRKVEKGDTETIEEPMADDEVETKGQVVDLMTLLKRSVAEHSPGRQASTPPGGRVRGKTVRRRRRA